MVGFNGIVDTSTFLPVCCYQSHSLSSTYLSYDDVFAGLEPKIQIRPNVILTIRFLITILLGVISF